MEITRTSDTSIKCVISKSEIAEAGVSVTDILENKNGSIEFLHKLVDTAAKEVGYEDVERLNTLQMAVIQDDIVLHISENGGDPSQFKKDILEKIQQMSDEDKKSFIGAHRKEIAEELKKMVNEMMGIKENLQAKKRAASAMELAEVENKIREVPYMFSFVSFGDLCSYIASVDFAEGTESQLYKYRNEYVLVLMDGHQETDALVFGKAILKASDYGTELSQEPLFLSHLEETAECLIIENAIGKLAECLV